MCWSAEVSLNTFLFSACVFVIALVVGFKPKIMFLYFWFILMQLIEFFLWRNITNKSWERDSISSVEWNHLISFMAFLLLAIHPFAFCLIITDPVIQQWFLVLYILFLSLTLYIYETETVDYSASVAKNGHLSWNWTKNYTITYYIYTIFFFVLWIEKYYATFIIIFVTYIYSAINYYYEGTFSSLWCWSANIVGVFIILHILYRSYWKYILYIFTT